MRISALMSGKTEQGGRTTASWSWSSKARPRVSPVEESPPARIDARTAWVLAFTLLVWGSAVVGIRGVVRYYSPGHVALARFLTATALLAAPAIWRRIRLPAARDVPQLL